MGEKKELVGWFSLAAAERFGTGWYEAPDGREVEVTLACSPGWGEKGYGWPDKISLGPVTRWLRDGGRGNPPPL